MKIKVNTEIIKAMNPCAESFNNYLEHYSNFDGDILEFLALDSISPTDKIWVSVRLMTLDQLQIFAIDSAFSVQLKYAAYATYAAAARAAAAYAADAYAASAAARQAEYEDRVDAIAWIIENDKQAGGGGGGG